MSTLSHLRRTLNTNNTLFFNCDITEGMKSSLYSTWNVESIVKVALMMAKIVKILHIPLLVTEHAPKAFGYTLPEIKQILPPEHFLFEKTQFSMITEAGRGFLDKYPERKNVVLYGMETHICIQQTCFSLLDLGYNVHLPADGITSKRTIDREAGLERLNKSGANVTSSESVIYELINDVKDKQFDEVKTLLAMNQDNKIRDLSW